MSQALTLHIDELVVPGASTAEGTKVAESLHTELNRLHGEDASSGRTWRRNLGSFELEFEPTIAGSKLGAAIAGEIRKRALEPEQAR